MTPSFPVSFCLLRVWAPLYSLYNSACGGGGCPSYSALRAGLGSHLCWRGPLRARVRASLHRGAVYVILASGMVPHTSLVTFVRCSSRVRGVACNILARLPPYPYLVVCCLSWRRCTPFSSERAGAGVFPPTLLVGPALVHTFVVLNFRSLNPPLWRGLFFPLLPAWLHTPLWCPLLVASPVCAAWHVTYLRGCNILTSPTAFRVPCVAAPLYSLLGHLCSLSFSRARRDM